MISISIFLYKKKDISLGDYNLYRIPFEKLDIALTDMVGASPAPYTATMQRDKQQTKRKGIIILKTPYNEPRQ